MLCKKSACNSSSRMDFHMNGVQYPRQGSSAAPQVCILLLPLLLSHSPRCPPILTLAEMESMSLPDGCTK